MLSSSIEDLNLSNSFVFVNKNTSNNLLKENNKFKGCFFSNIKDKLFNINKIYVGYSSDSEQKNNLKL